MHRAEFLRKHGWGVFFHYLNSLQNNPDKPNSFGRQTSWNDCVSELDTELLAEQVSSIGAPYVIFTVLQQTQHMIAPNAYFDRMTGYRPGEACAERDLVLDLYESLSRRGVDLLLYFTGDGVFRDEQAAKALGNDWPSQTVNQRYFQNWLPVLREYSERYGKKVRGWWLDGCYPGLGYDDARCEAIADAARAGNPEAAVAVNFYGCGEGYREEDSVIYADWFTQPPPSVPGDDFTAGEVNLLGGLPDDPMPGGVQWHLLSFLGAPKDPRMVYDGWGSPGCKYDPAWLGDYRRSVVERGGVLTLDLSLRRDGSIAPEQLEVMRGLAR